MRTLLVVSLAALLVGCGDDSSNPDGGGNDASTDSTQPPGDGAVNVDGGDGSTVDVGDSVITRSNHNTRDAVYVQPTFTTAGIATMKLDATFTGTISGNVYGQVLFFNDGPSGKPVVIVATENNQLSALDADTGAVVWQKTYGTPAATPARVAGTSRRSASRARPPSTPRAARSSSTRRRAPTRRSPITRSTPSAWTTDPSVRTSR